MPRDAFRIAVGDFSLERKICDNSRKTGGFVVGERLNQGGEPGGEAGRCERGDVWSAARLVLDEVKVALEGFI